MNIFYLDQDPDLAARYQCNKHVCKMIIETAQMLSTAHRMLDGIDYADEQKLYKCTHVNHPSTVWVRDSQANYQWTYDHLIALLNEYTHRYGKIHATDRLVNALAHIPDNIDKKKAFVAPPLCMDDEFKQRDHIEAYRDFYFGAKHGFAKWTKRDCPAWFYERVFTVT